jgi:hypothetical protein
MWLERKHAGHESAAFLDKLFGSQTDIRSPGRQIGAEVNAAVGVLAPIIAGAPADEALRGKWTGIRRANHLAKSKILGGRLGFAAIQ